MRERQTDRQIDREMEQSKVKHIKSIDLGSGFLVAPASASTPHDSKPHDTFFCTQAGGPGRDVTACTPHAKPQTYQGPVRPEQSSSEGTRH